MAFAAVQFAVKFGESTTKILLLHALKASLVASFLREPQRPTSARAKHQ
jgi:hypothetical protein